MSFKKGTENRVQGDNSWWHTVHGEEQLKVERMKAAIQVHIMQGPLSSVHLFQRHRKVCSTHKNKMNKKTPPPQRIKGTMHLYNCF